MMHSTTGQKCLVILGATGMVGGYALRCALDDPSVGRVTTIVRRKLAISHPKLKEVLHRDLADCSPLADVLSAHDAAIFCLGTYTGAVTDAELRTITVNYTVEFARVLHASSPEAAFSFLSGSGADPSGRSRMSFARYKGEAEKALLAAGFPRVYIFRPAYIYPVEPRKEPNFSYRLLRAIYPAFRLLFPNQVIPADDLARAMVKVVVEKRWSVKAGFSRTVTSERWSNSSPILRMIPEREPLEQSNREESMDKSKRSVFANRFAAEENWSRGNSGRNPLKARAGHLLTTALCLLVFCALPSASRAQVPTYEVTPEESSIKFGVDSSVSIRGTFEKWDASIKFSSRDVRSAVLDIEIEAGSVNTGSHMKDSKLKGRDFFSVKESPFITFKSTKIVQTGPNTFDVEGNFTIRGVTKTEKLTLTSEGKGTPSGGLDGTMAFDRKDYGMTSGIPFIKIANRVEVNVRLKWRRVSGPPPLFQQ